MNTKIIYYILICVMILLFLILYYTSNLSNLSTKKFVFEKYIKERQKYPQSKPLKLCFVNFWEFHGDNIWFLDYFKNRISPSCKIVSVEENPDIIFFSVFGDRNNLIKYKAKLKIFFTGENLKRYPSYDDEDFLYENIDIVIGFRLTKSSKKIYRFPLWLLYYKYYSMDNDNDNVLTFLQKSYTENKNIPNKKLQATLLASHPGILRQELYDEFSKYMPVLCPGSFIKNHPEEVKDKISFIKMGIYNICTENSHDEGYVTEKIIEALQAGCIPVYSGFYPPEPDILEENCYCFVTKENLSEKVKDVVENKDKYIQTTIFKDTARDALRRIYSDFENQIIYHLEIKNSIV